MISKSQTFSLLRTFAHIHMHTHPNTHPNTHTHTHSQENDIINDDLLSPGPQQAVTEITVTAVEKKNQTNSDSMDNNNSNCTQLQRVTFFATDNEINTKL